MRGSRSWRVASRELAEVVQVAAPRVVLAAAVAAALVVVPVLLRLAVFLPGWTS
jgi:hypothetical protein